MVRLTSDEALEVENNTLSLAFLSLQGAIGMLKSGNFLTIAGTLLLEIFGDTLLQDKCLERIISLSFASRKSKGEPRSIVFLLNR